MMSSSDLHSDTSTAARRGRGQARVIATDNLPTILTFALNSLRPQDKGRTPPASTLDADSRRHSFVSAIIHRWLPPTFGQVNKALCSGSPLVAELHSIHAGWLALLNHLWDVIPHEVLCLSLPPRHKRKVQFPKRRRTCRNPDGPRKTALTLLRADAGTTLRIVVLSGALSLQKVPCSRTSEASSATFAHKGVMR